VAEAGRRRADDARAGGGGRTTQGRERLADHQGNRQGIDVRRFLVSTRKDGVYAKREESGDAGTYDENSLARERRLRRPQLTIASGTSRANLRVEGCRMASCHFLAS
jgi:hypothetical protein